MSLDSTFLDVDIIVKPKYSSVTICKEEQIIEGEYSLAINIPPPFKRTKVAPAYYFWLVWSIISILNRLAILAAVNYMGKLYILAWFYNVIFTESKSIALNTQALFITILFLMVGSGYSLYIPLFSVCLILIDFAMDFILKYNFIQQLLIKTSIYINRQDRKIHLTQNKNLSTYKEVINYNSKDSIFSNIFLTISEKH